MMCKSFYEMNYAEQQYRINQAWRHLARRIFVFLKANPDILAINDNQEIFDAVREIQIKHRLKESPGYAYDTKPKKNLEGTTHKNKKVQEIAMFLELFCNYFSEKNLRLVIDKYIEIFMIL